MGRGAKKLAVAGVMVLGLRLATVCGAGAVIGNWVESLADDGRLISASLSLELGVRDSTQTPEPGTPLPTEAAAEVPETPEVSSDVSPDESPSATAPGYTANGTEILETTIYGGLAIRNNTNYDIDLGSLLTAGAPQTLPAEGPQILIIHTHGSEAYTPDSLDKYVATDTDRTEDTNYNVVRVGDELAEAYEELGLNVIHDREIYDYPSYTGSYSRSGDAVAEYLAEYPDIAIVIDLHRDALGDGDVVYKTVAELNGVSASQVMMLVGTGENGLAHPGWEDNLRLALYLQQAINTTHPTLARPITVAHERYNQHLTSGSMILEVGSSGNTLREALAAIELFAKVTGPALLELVEDT